MKLMSRIARLFERRTTPENPSFNLNDPEAWDALGASRSATGVGVSLKTLLGYAPFRRGLNLIGNYVGKLPMIVYRRDGDGKVRDTQHPAARLIRWKPNREMNAFDFLHLMTWQGIIGGSYAYIFRKGDGSPEELIPLVRDRTFPVREEGKLWYVTSVQGQQRKLLPENVLHVKGISPDGIAGYELVNQSKETVGLGVATREYSARFFSNNAEPRVVLEHPGKMSPEGAKNLREGWNEMHRGLENSHRTAVLEEGMKANVLSMNAKESQLIEARKFEIREVANWLDLPPHKLGDDSRTAFASLEQENQAFLDDSLDPWLCRIEQEFREKLLTEQEKFEDTHVIEFMRQALVRADIEKRSSFYTMAVNNRIMSPNEIRARENLNPYPGGDEFLVPKNIGNPGGNPDAVPKPSQPQPSNDPDVQDEEELASKVGPIHRQILIDVLKRMIKRIAKDAHKASKAKDKFTAWMEGLESRHSKTLREAMGPVVAAHCILVKRDDLTNTLVEELFLGIRKRLGAAFLDSPDAQFTSEVDRRMDEAEKTLPPAIAERLFGKAGE